MLRASDKPTSQDGCEKVERNARVYPSCRSETGTHTDSCTSETHIKSRLLAAAKGYKHKPPQLGPPRLQTSFLCSFKQHVLINKLLNKSIRFLTHRLSHKLNKHMQLLKPGTTLKTHSDPCAETGWFTQKGGAQSAFPSWLTQVCHHFNYDLLLDKSRHAIAMGEGELCVLKRRMRLAQRSPRQSLELSNFHNTKQSAVIVSQEPLKPTIESAARN